MHHLTLTRALKLIYPYWVITRVIALVLGSLVFLVLHETIRQLLRRPRSLAKRELSYVNRTN